MPDIIERVLAQCSFAIGAGAGMKIQLKAIGDLQDHVRPGFKRDLERPRDQGNPNDTEPGEPRWKEVDNFILDCCDAIGRLAASNATTRGSRVIDLEDLKPAYNAVSDANRPPVPGNFCPPW